MVEGRSGAGRFRMLAAAGLAIVAGCAGPAPEPGAVRAPLGPTRGYILISLDTLSALHLGAYGGRRPTSPFFDALAERGTLFENAFVQYPSTLVSHVSMFTGLYPQQHGVYPPSSRLSPAVPVLPERFAEAGYRTAGHTEGGFVSGGYGFSRGFDEFSDPAVQHTTDIEQTLGKGLAFLRRLDEDERFFLFLHTYSIHDPYEPPEPYASMFGDGEPPGTPAALPIGEINRGLQTLDTPAIDHFAALYDGGIRYADWVLAGFFEELERLGLTDETTIVVTSDHGEEFLEHGRLGHTQLYPETLQVPLLLLHPEGPAGRRVAELVQSIDIAPTLLDLAGLPPLGGAGRSLLPLVEGRRQPDRLAYAEVLEARHQVSILEQRQAETLQLVRTTYRAERGGTWISRRAEIDWSEPLMELSLASFLRPRRLSVTVDGDPLTTLEVGTSWSRRTLELPGGGPLPHRVGLATPGCDSPEAVGKSTDARCLSIKVRGIDLRRTELFDLSVDRAAGDDLARVAPGRVAELTKTLDGLSWEPVAPALDEGLAAEEAEALRALGYIE